MACWALNAAVATPSAANTGTRRCPAERVKADEVDGMSRELAELAIIFCLWL